MFFISTPIPGEMIQFDMRIFFIRGSTNKKTSGLKPHEKHSSKRSHGDGWKSTTFSNRNMVDFFKSQLCLTISCLICWIFRRFRRRFGGLGASQVWLSLEPLPPVSVLVIWPSGKLGSEPNGFGGLVKCRLVMAGKFAMPTFKDLEMYNIYI